jgi:ATP-dependent HslUV protease subunit HslV
VTFGEMRLPHGYEANSEDLRDRTRSYIGASWVGMAGTVAHFPVLRQATGQR